MNLRELVAFAQSSFAGQAIVTERVALPTSPQNSAAVLQTTIAPDEHEWRDSNKVIERPPLPTWLTDASTAEIIPLDDLAGPVIDDAAHGRVLAEVAKVTGQKVDVKTGADALAYYLPYHFYADGTWGIYIRLKGVLNFGLELSESSVLAGNPSSLKAALNVLLNHEHFHCIAETAATCVEMGAQKAAYASYFKDMAAAHREEALANANAIQRLRHARLGYEKEVRSWMKEQGPGYRDFDDYLPTRRFRNGQAEAGTRMIMHANSIRWVKAAYPSDWLFMRVPCKDVPTYLVVEEDVASLVLKPFPKEMGMLVKVHTNEHTPPHIHVEMPVGKEKTRCVWPELQPVKGDPPLSGAETKTFFAYLRKHGDSIHKKVAAVYKTEKLDESVWKKAIATV